MYYLLVPEVNYLFFLPVFGSLDVDEEFKISHEFLWMG